MAGKPIELDQEWSVHAQLTFSRGSPQLSTSVPVSCIKCPQLPHPCYGFQRGNIIFTTKPPSDNSVYNSLPNRRATQPYGRRCMSTCNITLAPQDPLNKRCHHTVTLSCDDSTAFNNASDYCDICSGSGRSPTSMRRAHTFTSHFCTRVPDKTPIFKDVASQTSQGASVLTDQHKSNQHKSKDLLQVPFQKEESSRDRSKSPKNGRRLTRSPVRLKGISPLLNRANSDAKKKPRTVHIDVYCTGSDISNSSDQEENNSPQTVYESENLCVTHSREENKLPQALCRQRRKTLSAASTSSTGFISKAEEVNKIESNDTLSSIYPTQMSGSSATTVGSSLLSDSSFASHLSSSCALFSDESGTSWKDTSTADSLLGVNSILGKSDSFDYADSLDKLRILEKERAWDTGTKTWKSPQVERKHLLQQKKHQQYLERRGSPFPRWKPDDDSSDESDFSEGSEMAWSFGRLEDLDNMNTKLVKREDTVRKAPKSTKTQLDANGESVICCDSGSLSDSATPSSPRKYLCQDLIGPFGLETEPPPKPKLESSVTSPFSSVPGVKTDQLNKAEKFGAIIGTFKKPGHHVGPSKNPDCSCENCRKFYEEKGYRSRTHSLGDMPSLKQREYWKAKLNNIVQNRLTEDSGSGECDV
uniref:Uncharacterized protein n=1 Tax=Clastoptera arizonana TaxID=38151 RepID=A0A1B6C1K6_9HEMI